MKTFVQIGTNNGNDEFNEIVRLVKPDLVVLVEPNTSLIEEIVKNYDGVKNVHLTPVAITGEGNSTATMFIKSNMNKEGELDGIRYDGGYSLLPLDDWGNELDAMNVRTMTFAELCAEYDITHIDYLQIDTEGYDAEIIKSIDFDKITIEVIKYEWWGFPEVFFTRHKDKGVLCGDKGMQFITDKLIGLGYKLTRSRENVIARKI
jgi:FkbM family methyltransferase